MFIQRCFWFDSCCFKRPQQECDHVPADSRGSSALSNSCCAFELFIVLTFQRCDWMTHGKCSENHTSSINTFHPVLHHQSCSSLHAMSCFLDPRIPFTLSFQFPIILLCFSTSLSLLKVWSWYDFINGFERSLFCSPRLYLFDQKYSKTVIL